MKSLFSTTSKRLIYQNPWIKLFECDILRRGELGLYSVVQKNDCTVIIPLTPSGKTLLVKQYRYPVDSVAWEFPGGASDDGESLEDTAKRELREETNISSDTLEKIGEFFPMYGLCTQKAHIYVAHISDEELSQAKLMVEDEIIDIKIVSIDDIPKLIETGEIVDGFTLSALVYLRSYMGKSKHLK